MDGTTNGPSTTELRLIDAEWPLITAEMAVVDVEAAIARGDGISDLDRLRLRRAKTLAMRRMREFYNSRDSGTLDGVA